MDALKKIIIGLRLIVIKKIGYTLLLSGLMTLVCVARPNSSVVGAWVQEADSMRWTFRPDGTGFMERGNPKMTARFKWNVKGRILEVSTAGTSVPYKLVESTANTLIIKNQHVLKTYTLQKQ